MIQRNRGTAVFRSVPLVKEIDGIMWRRIASTFICLYFCCLLLPALSHEEMFGRKLPRAGKVLDGSQWSTLHSTSVLVIKF